MKLLKPQFAGVAVSVAALCAAAAGFFATADKQPRVIPGRVAAAAITATVPGRRPQTLPASLQLNGSVVDMGTASTGTLTLRIGNATTTTTVSLPAYSVPLASAQPEAMVSIEIQAPGYRYASVLGSYARLARQSGGDGQLEVAELDRLRLSPFSTALHFFVLRDLGGRLPVSDDEHESVIRATIGGDLQEAVALLVGLDAGTLVLPAEQSSGYSLLSDRQAYSLYRADNPQVFNDSQTLESALEQLSSIPLSAADISPLTVLATDLYRSEATLIPPQVQVLEATPGGMLLHSGSPNRRVIFTRDFVGGALKLTPQGEYVLSSSYVSVDGPVQVLQQTSLTGVFYRRVFGGDRFSLWASTVDYRASYPDRPDLGAIEGRFTGLWTASSLSKLPPFQGADALSGVRALPTFCAQVFQPSGTCEFAEHRFFANGTGRTENVGAKIDANMEPIGVLGGESFEWNTSSRGSFEVRYANAKVRYWQLHPGDDKTDLLVYVATSQEDGQQVMVAGAAPMIHGDGGGGFGELPPDGTWRYASFEQYKPPYAFDDPVERPFDTSGVFSRNPDGTAVQTEFSPTPGYASYLFNYRAGWQLLDGRLYETRYRANVSTGVASTAYFSSCAQAAARGASQCAPFRVRYFRPLSRSGNRLYGIEELYQQSTTDYVAPYTYSRISRGFYYEKFDPPAVTGQPEPSPQRPGH